MQSTPSTSRILASVATLVGIIVSTCLITATFATDSRTGLTVNILALTASGLAATFVVLWLVADIQAIAWQNKLKRQTKHHLGVDIEGFKDATDEALDYQLRTYCATFVAKIKQATEGITLDEVLHHTGELPPPGPQVIEAVLSDQPLDRIISLSDTPDEALTALMITSGAVISRIPRTAPSAT